jgi:hypothetical protein
MLQVQYPVSYKNQLELEACQTTESFEQTSIHFQLSVHDNEFLADQCFTSESNSKRVKSHADADH